MYSRQIDDKTYTFEASGGLLNASLVMQDRETDSYWSIMTHEALHGAAKGHKLEQLPGSVKMPFGEWKKRHPDTLVLSYQGREHVAYNPYEDYFRSSRGFNGISARDSRLKDKAMIYSFHWNGKPYAVPHEGFTGGGVVRLGDRELFLYREKRDSFYRASAVYLAPAGVRFVRERGRWMVSRDGHEPLVWDEETRTFGKAADGILEPFQGFDTYWYIWSLTNEDTEVTAARQP